MPKTWQPHTPKAGTTPPHNIPIALRKMGNAYPSSLLTWQGASEVSDCRCRLLHQMDRSQTINHYHSLASSTVRLEGHHMQIWRPTHHHYLQ